MKTLAITGGIGGGKSHAIGIFAAMGIPVYNADERTKQLYVTDMELQERLKAILGDDIIKNCRIDRPLMANRLFGNAPLLYEVEKVVFPAVLKDIYRWKKSQENSGAPFVIIESAIFLEKPEFADTADKVLTVSAPLELRIERVMARDSITREAVCKRVAHQWSDARREEAADFTLITDGEHPLMPQVMAVIEKMKR